MAERKAWWEILRDQFASRGLLDPESERLQEAAQAAPAVQRQARGLLSLDPQAESDTALEMGLGALPGVGQAMALRDLERARRAKDPAAGAMAAASLIPFGKALPSSRTPVSMMAEQAPKKPMTLAQAFRVSPQSLHSEKLNKMSAEDLESLADDLYEEIQSVSDDVRSYGPNYAVQEPAGYLFEYLQNNAGKFTGDWNSIVRDFLETHVDKNPQRVGQALRAAGRAVAQYKFNEPDAVKVAAEAMAKK
jgi:hypothetical protein